LPIFWLTTPCAFATIDAETDCYAYKFNKKVVRFMFNLTVFKKIISFALAFFPILFTMSNPDPDGTPVVVNENAANQYINEYMEPDISAHRSGAGIAPQNTMMAFEVCVNSKEFSVDIFEFDVQITKDGELVLLHDLTYDATSNAEEHFGRSNISPMFYDFQVLYDNLNLGAKFGDGEAPYSELRGEDIPENLRVVKCEEILDYTEASAKKGKPYKYIIEIKSPLFWGMRAADKLYEILKERDLLDRTIVGTFLPDVAAYIDWKYPDMNRSAGILEVLEFYFCCRAGLDLSERNVKYSVLQIPYPARLLDRDIINLGTREIMNYAHKYDIAVQYWTVNEAGDMIYLTENGADAIMTDWPGLAKEASATASK